MTRQTATHIAVLAAAYCVCLLAGTYLLLFALRHIPRIHW